MNIFHVPKKVSFFALFLVLSGVFYTNAMAHDVKNEESIDYYDHFFDDMRKMHKAMDDMFEKHQLQMKKVFEDDKNNAKTQISKKEDDKGYYYELSFDGYDKDDILVSVKDGSIIFQAKKELKEKKDGGNSYSRSNFYYSFSVPKDVVKTEPKIVREDNKVLVEFSK